MIETTEVLYVADMARVLGRTEAAIRSCVQRQRLKMDNSFPTHTRIAGRVCWKRREVQAWLEKMSDGQTSPG